MRRRPSHERTHSRRRDDDAAHTAWKFAPIPGATHRGEACSPGQIVRVGIGRQGGEPASPRRARCMPLRIVSVDVGILNLAFAEMDGEEIVDFQTVNITVLRHTRVSRCECRLFHGNSLTDRVMHFLQEERDRFDRSDVVLVEQQPPGGHQAVEQLVFSEFRHKAHLVSPTGMHSYFGIRSLAYEDRKRAVEALVTPLLTRPHRDRLLALERRHDVCDAICISIYWYRRKGPRSAPSDAESFIASFAFQGPRTGASRRPRIEPTDMRSRKGARGGGANGSAGEAFGPALRDGGHVNLCRGTLPLATPPPPSLASASNDQEKTRP